MPTDADRRRIYGDLRPMDEPRGYSPFAIVMSIYCVLILVATIGLSLYLSEPPAAASPTIAVSEANLPAGAVEASPVTRAAK